MLWWKAKVWPNAATSHGIGGRLVSLAVVKGLSTLPPGSTAERSPINSSTLPGREAQAESTGERQPLTYRSEDTMVNISSMSTSATLFM